MSIVVDLMINLCINSLHNVCITNRLKWKLHPQVSIVFHLKNRHNTCLKLIHLNRGIDAPVEYLANPTTKVLANAKNGVLNKVGKIKQALNPQEQVSVVELNSNLYIMEKISVCIIRVLMLK